MQVVKVDNKVFVGKDIIFCNVFKRKDDRTIYNMIYKDGNSGNTLMKRFPVTSITRNKQYLLTKSEKNSKVLYFTSNPNGEAELVTVYLRKLARLKNLKIDIDFSNLSIKGKTAIGNIVTKNPVKKVELKSEGVSTLSARKIWFDDNVQRLNVDGRGDLLGSFQSNDSILVVKQSGELELKSFEISNHFDEDMILIEKYHQDKPLTAIYYDGKNKNYYVKRFIVNTNLNNKFKFISNHKDTILELVSYDWQPQIELVYIKERGKERKKDTINLAEFISIKGDKAMGNRLSSKKIKEINLLESLPYDKNISDQDVAIKNIELDDNDESKGQITLNI